MQLFSAEDINENSDRAIKPRYLTAYDVYLNWRLAAMLKLSTNAGLSPNQPTTEWFGDSVYILFYSQDRR